MGIDFIVISFHFVLFLVKVTQLAGCGLNHVVWLVNFCVFFLLF